MSIGLGQLCHVIRRNVNVLYLLENNGVYGLTKGQFSASADPGSTKRYAYTREHKVEVVQADFVRPPTRFPPSTKRVLRKT